MKYIGNFLAGATIAVPVNTHKADGTPITLAGTPTVAVYKRGSTTETTSGVTLTVDYDSRTGYHKVLIDTSSDGTFYAAGYDYDVVITAGTVDSISVVGTVIGSFSIDARASHVSAGTGTGQIDLSSGVVKSNLVSILGTALTETVGGYIAAAFRKLFNVQAPVMTTESVNQTGDAYALVNTRLTSARAGYLDNLNTGGVVATQADVLAINQSATRRIILSTVAQYERPESGSTTYQVEARTYTADGAPVNADSTPTLTATGISSGSLSANIGTATNPSTGVYRWSYTVASSATLEQVRFDISATIATEVNVLSCPSQVCDFVAATFTTADRTKLEAIETRLPADPADQSAVEAAVSAVGSKVDALGTPLQAGNYDAPRNDVLEVIDTMIESPGAYSRFRLSALEQAPGGSGLSTDQAGTLADLKTMITGDGTADAKFTAKALEDGPSGSAELSAETQAQINAIESIVTAMQGAKVIQVPSPIGADGTINVIAGYDFKASSGSSIPFSNPEGSWQNLTGATISIVERKRPHASFGGSVDIVTPTGANQLVRWNIGKSDLDSFGIGSCDYILQAVLSGGDTVILATGSMNIE